MGKLTHGLGVGIGWRPEIADAVASLPGLDWVEVVAENLCADHLPAPLAALRERGVTVVPHGVSLGLGGADRPDADRLAQLAAKAELLGTPLVTEHIAFVRGGGPLTASPRLEAGHLLPVPRTWDALDVLCENVRIAQDALPVPLALENIAALVNWPGEQLTEGQFLAELVERTGVRLLIDVANLHTNHVNRGEDPARALAELPVEAIAYVHVAGGVERDGVWHDTHAHPVPPAVLRVLAELRSRVCPPGVLLERDDDFPPAAELESELRVIRETARLGDGGGVVIDGGRGRVTGDAARRTRDMSPVTLDAARRTRDTSPVTHDAVRRTHGIAPVSGGLSSGVRDTAPVLVGAGARASGAPMPTAAAPSALAPAPSPTPADTAAARQRLALAQTSLLSALVAGTPAPGGFDTRRLGVQARALVAKRAGVVAKVAPELPEILGDAYRSAFSSYARSRPMRDGYRRDALDFAEHLLVAGRPADPRARRLLTRWWQERAGARPPGRARRLVWAARDALGGGGRP
ncbi:DUF692 domain-containing protein [Streptomyces sp. NPDC001941]|uniref:DUF692 domain-containing protein n=1 Tax=Streptomyces sp. NPDC001941 TaxID=3154659 RepID=UPI00332D80BF